MIHRGRATTAPGSAELRASAATWARIQGWERPPWQPSASTVSAVTAIVGQRVCGGRAPGARRPGWDGSRLKLEPRLCSTTPVSGSSSPAPKLWNTLWISDTAVPSASTAVIATVSPVAGGPAGWGRGEGSAAQQQAGQVDGAGARVAEQGVAGQLGAAGVGQEVLGAEYGEEGRALARRGSGGPLGAIGVDGQRVGDLGPVGGEIRRRQRAAQPGQPGREALPELPRIEGAPIGGECVEGGGERRLDQDAAAGANRAAKPGVGRHDRPVRPAARGPGRG